jgi:hypothetical protein
MTEQLPGSKLPKGPLKKDGEPTAQVVPFQPVRRKLPVPPDRPKGPPPGGPPRGGPPTAA